MHESQSTTGRRRSRAVLALLLSVVLPLALAVPALAQPSDRGAANQARVRGPQPPPQAQGHGPWPPDQARQRVRQLPAPAQRVFCNVPDQRIGVQLWTLRSLMGDVEGTLAAVAEIGYQNVEPYSFHGYTAAEFRELLDRYGLSAPSMHTNVGALASDPAQVARDAVTIGADYAVLAWVGDEWRTPEGIVALAELLNEAGAVLQEHGVQLGYHNHDFEFLNHTADGQTMFEYLIEHTDPDLVDFQLDIYWAQAAGVDPARLVEEHGDRITLLHVKDMAPGGGFEDVGEGVIDFCDIFVQQRFDYYFVENDQPGSDPLGAIATSYANLRSLRFQQGL